MPASWGSAALIAAVCLAGAAGGCGGPPDNGPSTDASSGARAGRTGASSSNSGEDQPGEGGVRRGKTFTFMLPLDILKPQQDAILTTLDGTVGDGMLGHVHGLAEDEDLHFSLDVPAVESPVVCELMNALSSPPDAGSEYWSGRFASLFSGGSTVRVGGVFRLWPDHAAAQSTPESDRATSNPPHVVEIHPVASVESGGVRYVTVANISPITYEGEQYTYKDPSRWGDMLSHDIDAVIERKGEREYLRLTTPEVGFNYWELHVQVVSPAAPVKNGHRFTVHILTPTRAYTETVRCFTVAGTQADAGVPSLSAGSEATLAAIGRFDLRKLLSGRGYHGPIPVELCVFGINPPELRSVRRSEERSRARRFREGAPGIDAAAASGEGERYSPRNRTSSGPGSRYIGAAGAAGKYAAGAEFIGNRRSHIYHPADAGNLPSPQNRVYFDSEAEARAAGFRPALR
ncbi:MAG: hypothetical protein LC772_07370 [Chloroflexi bacterium]|nr:hypothetical protein [Chloroflexota bacterium]